MNWKVISLLVVVRVASVFIVQTFFSPDEYWQATEVAHKLTFGYGHLTWEWKHGIRSYFYPMIISVFYKLLHILKLDTTLAIVYLPRILQALLTAIADYRFYVWCNRKKWSLFVIITSWFWFYTGSRTLINTLEACFTTIALSIFPWKRGIESNKFIWIVGLLANIRPTSIITWTPLCIYHVNKSRFSTIDLIVKRYIPVGIAIAALLSALDTYFHGSFIVTPYEFFKFNVLRDVGSFYGSNPWHWYITSGFPAILGIYIIPLFLAIGDYLKYSQQQKERQIMLQSILATTVVMSLLPHKEFRFLLIVLPLCLYIIVEYMAKWSRSKSRMTIWFMASILFVANALPAIYLGHFHQQAPEKVMNKISELALEQKNMRVFFMMPCHSTPYYSHVHVNITMRFLTCEPNFDNRENYRDQADYFYEQPMNWIRKHLPVRPLKALPTHLVIYDTLALRIGDFLSVYQTIDIFPHSQYLTSSRVGQNMVLLQRMEMDTAAQSDKK